jgi:hypothetical protein
MQGYIAASTAPTDAVLFRAERRVRADDDRGPGVLVNAVRLVDRDVRQASLLERGAELGFGERAGDSSLCIAASAWG